MLSLAFDRTNRVLCVTISGIYGSDDMDKLDRLLIELVARYGQMRGIFDFTDVDAFAIPESRLLQRAQQPEAIQERIMVASRIAGGEAARAYGRHQCDAGSRQATVASGLDEAYRMLGLEDPRFEPVER